MRQLQFYIARFDESDTYARKIGVNFAGKKKAEAWLTQYGNRFDYVGERYTKTKKGKA